MHRPSSIFNLLKLIDVELSNLSVCKSELIRMSPRYTAVIFETSFDQFNSVNETLVPPAIGPYNGLAVTEGSVFISISEYH